MSKDTVDSNDPAFLHFAGWGEFRKIEDLDASSSSISHLDQEHRHFLGTWKATAICGNDITSSCLYVSGLAIATAGVMAPFALLLVSFTLFLFRKIYAEVGSALPMNGGTYTLLLNTTTKKKAAMAATLTILSYIATAVISANEALHYIHTIYDSIPVVEGTLVLLGLFAVLSIVGVSESANVALGIFIIHLLTLTVLIGGSAFALLHDSSALFENLKTVQLDTNWGAALFRGFLVGLLGISGFESSANYIEEQSPGVFPKTLKNMWVSVTVLNPVICLLALSLFTIPFISANQNGLLARMGGNALGGGFSKWVAINAFLVLSGAVLTSFVGIIGLVRRMALDRCLPQFLLRENALRKTNHWIILAFFAVCVSVLYFTNGKIESLASVYTISFLFVMLLFGIGNMLLKVRRGKLPRADQAQWPTVIIACALVGIGLIGNLLINPDGTKIFMAYYAGAVSIVLLMLWRTTILRFILQATQASENLLPGTRLAIRNTIENLLKPIISKPVIYFTKGDNIATLNNAALYVLKNEQTKHLQFVNFYQDEKSIPPSLFEQAKVIDQLYPQLTVDIVVVCGVFNPASIESLSKRLAIEKNRMFIGTPGNKFPHRVEKLGGVRVII
ncbi:MAG: APC family permease [Proteobacteria bacterium]|nr:MAG: APC family permease [Pseudomonadota bacterium]